MNNKEKYDEFEVIDDDICQIFTAVANNSNILLRPITKRIYPFSNENIYDGISHLKLQDKQVCTVGSSGDQILTALFLGANNVTLIDANNLTKYYVELKISAIKALSFPDFLDYFNSENLLNHKYYSKVSYLLSDESKYFWDNIILETNEENHHDMIKQIILGTGFDDKIERKILMDSGRTLQPFLTNQVDYYKLKNILLNNNYQIEYLSGNLEEFDTLLEDRKFDLIMLSNIYDYFDEEKFPTIINPLIKNHLNKDGTIQLTHLFNAINDTYTRRVIFRSLLSYQFPQLEIYEKIVNGEQNIPDAHILGTHNNPSYNYYME